MRALACAAILSVLLLGCQSTRPRATGTVPVVYQIGFGQSHDHGRVAVERFSIGEAQGPHLQLFNHYATIPITIIGHVDGDKGWRPFIHAVHVSERLEPSKSVGEQAGIIEFTPIHSIREDSTFPGGAESFTVQLMYPVSTWDWGPNHYSFSCGDIQHSLQLEQRK
jgi:hypothetical protein